MTPGDKAQTTRSRLVQRVLDPDVESCAGFRLSQQVSRLEALGSMLSCCTNKKANSDRSLTVLSTDDAASAGVDGNQGLNFAIIDNELRGHVRWSGKLGQADLGRSGIESLMMA